MDFDSLFLNNSKLFLVVKLTLFQWQRPCSYLIAAYFGKWPVQLARIKSSFSGFASLLTCNLEKRITTNIVTELRQT